jgi:hypothetical protein
MASTEEVLKEIIEKLEEIESFEEKVRFLRERIIEAKDEKLRYELIKLLYTLYAKFAPDELEQILSRGEISFEVGELEPIPAERAVERFMGEEVPPAPEERRREVGIDYLRIEKKAEEREYLPIELEERERREELGYLPLEMEELKPIEVPSKRREVSKVEEIAQAQEVEIRKDLLEEMRKQLELKPILKYERKPRKRERE